MATLRTGSARALAAAGPLLLALGCAAASAPVGHPPLLPMLAVTDVEVRPTALPGVDTEGSAWLQEALAAQARSAAGRAALERMLAGRLASAATTDTAAYRMSGFVALPIALPPDLGGMSAHFRGGALARACLTLTDATGRPLSRGQAVVRWDDVRWMSGARSARWSRRVELPLMDAVDASVARAVAEVEVRLRQPPLAAEPPPCD